MRVTTALALFVALWASAPLRARAEEPPVLYVFPDRDTNPTSAVLVVRRDDTFVAAERVDASSKWQISKNFWNAVVQAAQQSHNGATAEALRTDLKLKDTQERVSVRSLVQPESGQEVNAKLITVRRLLLPAGVAGSESGALVKNTANTPDTTTKSEPPSSTPCVFWGLIACAFVLSVAAGYVFVQDRHERDATPPEHTDMTGQAPQVPGTGPSSTVPPPDPEQPPAKSQNGDLNETPVAAAAIEPDRPASDAVKAILELGMTLRSAEALQMSRWGGQASNIALLGMCLECAVTGAAWHAARGNLSNARTLLAVVETVATQLNWGAVSKQYNEITRMCPEDAGAGAQDARSDIKDLFDKLLKELEDTRQVKLKPYRFCSDADHIGIV